MEEDCPIMEGSSDISKRIARESGFLDLIFSWSLEDIFNENLYSQEVKKIPESFETVPEYSGSFVYPLLEETRADLCSSVEIISRAPFAEVVSYVETERSYVETKCGQSLLYDFTVDEWRNRFNDRGKEPYKTLPGDIFAVVQFRPETIHDLRVVAETWVLASVVKIPKDNAENEVDDVNSSTFFRVKASKDIEFLDDNFNSLFVVFLMNITTNKRIWNALHMSKNLKIIKEVLRRDIVDEGDSHPCDSTANDSLFENISMEISSRLNRSQEEAVLGSLQVMQCKQKSKVELVWGPPGTGKTKTISTLLYYLLKMNCRTLTCAPTNVAITEVAGRLVESLEETFGFLGNILLFGNTQRLKVGSFIEDIYLDYRVKRLAECFAPLTGWRSCFPLLSNFLEDCVTQYNVFLENELLKTKDENNDKVGTVEPIESFLGFIRVRFNATADPVRRCISIFCTHVSRNYVGEHNLANMILLSDLLDSFEKLLLDNVNSQELLELFSSGEVKSSWLDSLLLLEEKRRKCISVLRILHRSLGDLNLPHIFSKESIIELCFQMASLIFCTASSSFKLYSMKMEPLSVLVIDEAAQLKECESAIPLQLPGLRHAILFGDECQLPATVKSKVSSDADFGRSLFQRLSMLGWPKHLLNIQYRMHPSISAFPNAQFYFNQILDAPSVKSTNYERRYLPGPMYGPYSFLNISEGREELDDDQRSRRNMVEAAVVAKILQNLYKTWRCSNQKLTIGVVSPYAAQVVAIEEMLGRRYENLDNFGVKVKSVDGFQGGEEDIIIISTVRANVHGSVGFICNAQRTNVALTRARHCLWVLGNERTLIRSDSIWKTLILDAKERHCFYNADEEKSLAEAMIDIKKELDQLDDLLNKDSILFRSARWKVLFSDIFVKTFSKLPSTRTKKSVMNLLVKLSNGWRPKKIKVDPTCENSLQIVKQYKVEGRYVICTNDIMKESRYTQVMKIWDIVPLEDVPKLVRRLENLYGAFTDEFLSFCKTKSLEGELEVPRTWSTSIEIVRYKSHDNADSKSASDADVDIVNYAENAKVSDSLLLMKFYSLSAGIVGHLLSDSDGRALDLPFEVTDEERQIIVHQKTSFILGRSGTGKTTVLTMKLFQKEQLHHMALEGFGEVNRDASVLNVNRSDESGESGNVLRQLFVTVSPKLCYAIKQHVSHLKSFARNESSSTASVSIDDDDIGGRDQFKGIPDSFVDIPPNSYPLVITFNKFLCMLDGTLGTSYFERFHDEMNLSDGLSSTSRSADLLMKRKEVNYDKFSLLYWPHFNSQHTKKLDASRVFTEIISVIKGGLQVGETDDGKLSMEGYLQLSEGRTSTLNRSKRELIYQIFSTYERMKAERGEFDLADLVNDLHRRLKHERYDGDCIDFVYIDEVQDLTMRQISLFKYVCKNIEEGFVFSGDTAQTIARGIDFRFQDVRCLFYKEFVMGGKTDGDHGSQEKGHISPICHLSQNFRTHAGILKLGHSVIQLIYKFFPHFIDILPPETSLIFGEAPILLESGSDENAIVTIFGNTENVGGNLVGFGAEQVILVRDDCVRKEISSYVGKHALVLTIVECKGLEFQDVLLYNFFGSSPLKNQWRVVYQYMKEQNLLDSTLPMSFPNFNPGKHNVLCSELKQLYVAITRTRQRLWICENKEDLSKPMFDYWKKLCVVQVRQLDDSLARAMQVASSPEEWKARGKKLLGVKNYEVATMCFERAGDKHWETFAKAAGLEASADLTRGLNPEEASKILRQAAELFESINEYKRAADCYYELKDYDRAGRIYLEHCGESDVERAGECFTLSGSYELAAKVYAKGNLFSKCLSSCTEGKLFDIGLQYIQYWKDQATMHQNSVEMCSKIDMIEQSFLEKCALSFLDQEDKKTMMKFVKAFSSEDSMRNFLKIHGCLDELLALEQELGNFSKAADIARDRGDLLLEADLLEKGGLSKEACGLFLWYAFASCLWAVGDNGWPLKHFPQREELLLKAKSSARKIESQLLYKTVCTDIIILLNRNHSLSVLKQLLIISQSLKNLSGEILSMRRILDLILRTDVSKYEYDSTRIEDLPTHSLERISQNRVSVETLIYFWSLWKETILAIFKYLEVIEETETSDFRELGEFCLNYLGVRKKSSNTSTLYVCLFPNAQWVRSIDKGFLKEFGKLVSIDKQRFIAAARNHFSFELFSDGMKVLKVLDALQKNATKSSSSSFFKTKIIIHVYEVAQLISSCKCLKQTHNDLKSLQTYTELSIKEHFNYVFPLDWRKSVSKDMIFSRESEISRKILEEVVVDIIQTKGKLTYGELGRVAVVLLGSRKGKIELCDKIFEKLDVDSPWKPFLEVFSNRAENNCVTLPQAQIKEYYLACKLRGALTDVYNANWRKELDYISPGCFLYLMDRLLVSLLEFQGTMLITRSSLVEWLTHLEWKVSPGSSLAPSGDESVFMAGAYLFLANVAHQFLVNTQETVEWVKKASFNAKENFPVILLRLVILLCLLHLNSGIYCGLLHDVLSKIDIRAQLQPVFLDAIWRREKIGVFWELVLPVLNRTDITSQLPPEFRNALRRSKKGGFINAVGEALKEIKDPLVIVSIGKNRSYLSCKDAVFLNLANQNREDLLRILFPEKLNILPASSNTDNQEKLSKHSPSIEGCLEFFKDGNIWELFDALKLVELENKTRQSFISNAPKIKVQVDKLYDLMTTVIAMRAENNACADEYKNFAGEAEYLLLELQLLSGVLDASGQQLKDSMLLITDISKRLLSGKPVFEYFLSPLIPQKDTIALDEGGEDKVQADDEDSKDEPLAAVAPGNQNGSKNNNGRNKGGEGANKSKPGKKKRGKSKK